jgi:hypothetical protein
MTIKNGKFISGRYKEEDLEEVAFEDPGYLFNLLEENELSWTEEQGINEALQNAGIER